MRNIDLKKVLIATGIYPPDIGGPATYSKLLKDEFPKHKIDVEILSFGEVRRLPKLIRHFVYFLKVLKNGRKADLIFAQDPVSVGFPVAIAAKILRKKFILKIVGDYAWEQYAQKSETNSNNQNSKFKTLEDFQTEKFDFITELRRKIERRVAKTADKIIVPSEYLKKIVLMWGIEDSKIKVVYNAFEIPESETRKEEAREKFDDGFLIVSVGRLTPWKGFDALIEIMPEIMKEIPGAKLYIIGSGPESEALKLKTINLELGTAVFLTGRLSQDEVLGYLKQSDLFVLNTGYEGLSHILLEAMAVGIPIITTNVGGNSEVIENGKEGILIEYNNKEQLKQAIFRLYKDENLREKFIINAKEKSRKFNKEKMIGETIRILAN